MAFLEIHNLTKFFQDRPAVDHVNIEIEKGTFLSLLGPSGCGKTTTLRMIAGFEKQDQGSIRIDGESIDHLPPYKRNMGFVFQSYALFPHMTVEENIAYGLEQRNYTRADIKKEVARVLEMVQLTGFEKRKPKKLSGGQQQRVALARALVIKPNLLLLDESLSALDKKLRVEMQVELKQIQQEIGITTLFVTHDQEEAMTLSDQIAVMKDGKIVQVGQPRSVYRNPANTFVANFIGESNLFKGKVLATDQGYCLRLENQEVFPLPKDSLDLDKHENEERILSVRPENIQLDVSHKDDAQLVGTIKFVTFAGNRSICLVESLGQEVKVQVQHSFETDRVRVGDRVYLSWNGKHQTVLSE